VNHPLLAIPATDVKEIEARERVNLRELQHAPKLLALKDLLIECGIGESDSKGMTSSDNKAITSLNLSQHRVLIFAQLKTMLDIIENDLFKNEMPSVTYMRLDGSVDPSKRHSLVQKFNSDPSIDVLLLTTHVGGLGLNLTGADTVIFVEHDWNPMKDLQGK
jgi:TATA-binding protein-associated factor